MDAIRNAMKEHSEFITSPMCAGAAVVPVFRGFMEKADLQLTGRLKHIPWRKALTEGVKAAPSVGLIVGTQMAAEGALKGVISDPGLTGSLSRAAVIGTGSSPFIAVFNGLASGMDWKTALRRITPKQVGAIAAQETSFVGGIAAAGPVTQYLKEKLGDNMVVEVAGNFIAGASGSFVGHPANTIFTRIQAGLPMEYGLQALYRGGRIKAVSCGVFTVIYKTFEKMANQ